MTTLKVRANEVQIDRLRERIKGAGLQVQYPEEQPDGVLVLFLTDLSHAHTLCEILASEGVHIVDLGDLKKTEGIRLQHADIFDSDAVYLSSANDITGISLAENQLKLAQGRLQKLEQVVDGLEEMIAVVDREYRYRIANNKFLQMRKMTKEEVVGRFAHQVLNKRVFETVVKPKLDECFKGKVVRYEMKYLYPDLGERDILVSYFPVKGGDGVDRVASIIQDITDRKRVEEALRGMHRKLIEAHEEERAWIARELHDDISQRLAFLSIALSALKQRLPASAVELVRDTEKVRKQAINLGSDIQALSHRLHSPRLELLGLTKATTALCTELSERQGVKIDFKADNVARKLPNEVALCLFRVLQEALQNAIKHSGSRHFQVWLRGRSNEIELTVHDSGRGFEPEEATNGPGLGLTSMRERMGLVNGQLSIDSKLQRGTTIRALAPIDSSKTSASAGK
jgi:PAS domain S-box-containing protein